MWTIETETIGNITYYWVIDPRGIAYTKFTLHNDAVRFINEANERNKLKENKVK